ncbi:glutamate receptor ionotropic, kainate 2-like isoform X3 [Lineus longissimus]|uniref:glutamate receptor ionotropic, kainate 2-like isoform X3 n=1 Tax=Lineus longissimus TaxID=88925 RepID=UPI00315C7771
MSSVYEILLRNVWIGLLLYIWNTNTGKGQPARIRIGGLFDYDNLGQELAFKYATDSINVRRDILPKTMLVAELAQVPTQDSFHAARKVCNMLRNGVATIFGPQSSLSAAHVQSICDSMEIPHIEAKWGFHSYKDYYSINLFPHYSALSRAYKDLVKAFDWPSFTILYENNDGLIRLQGLLNNRSNKRLAITVRKLDPDSGDFRPVLKEIRDRLETRIIVDCSTKLVKQILREADSQGMMKHYYHYLFTTLDLGLIDMSDFHHEGANITAFRLVNPDNPLVVDVISDWIIEEHNSGTSPLEGKRGIEEVKTMIMPLNFTTDTALIYDAVHLFAKALNNLTHAVTVEPRSLSCSLKDSWEQGSSLFNYMKMTEFDGLTGHVKFDGKGLRTTFSLQLVEIQNDGSTKQIGEWEPNRRLNITKKYSDTKERLIENNKTLQITTHEDSPFVFFNTHDDFGRELHGNDRFSGYCIDLLKEIAKIVPNFKYEIHIVYDGNYGSPVDSNNPGTTKWNGMVGELIEKKADLAVASLTISYIREKVIDFTKPFMNLGISILFKRPEKKNPELFSFLSPLSLDVWLYMLIAYLVVSFLLFVLARFSPYEWYNPHPCNPDSDIVENQFTIMNSLWFTIGSLMQQGITLHPRGIFCLSHSLSLMTQGPIGSEVAPRAYSTRICSGIWWFFTLIMISSYTANLAAFLTVERMISPIQSAEDLSKQTDIKYGTIINGSTYTFFKTSKIATYERMWNFMSSQPESVFVNSTTQGIEKVHQGGYAYLLESTMNEYFTQRQCDLMMVGGLLDSKGYGIGTPRGSPYRDILSDAILRLQEEQKLQLLYNEWWKEKSGGGKCDNTDPNNKDANELGVENVGGVFVVLLGGLALSTIVAIGEFIWKARKNADEDKVRRHESLCSEMGTELRFALQCMGSSKKPARKRRSPQADMMDNGLNLHVPLTGMLSGPGPGVSGAYHGAHGSHHTAVPGKELYA